MTDTPEQGSSTPFFAAEDDAVPGGYEEFQPADGGQPLAPEPSRPDADPLNAPAAPPPPAWPPPATEGAAQPELEQLLRDVRGALATLPGDDPEPSAQTSEPAPSATAGPDLGDLRAGVDGLRTSVGELRDSEALRHAELTARLDALAQSAADAVALAVARTSQPPAAPAGGPDGITMTDLHDGLAGVRTDVAALPDAIGPAVTSAVGHGLSETTRQVDGVSAALTETVAESGQLRAELASLQVTLASLHEQVSLLPQVLSSLRDVTDRLDGLAQPVASEPLPDLAGIVDERLAEHLTAFGTGLGERLDSQLDALQGLVAPAGAVTHDDLVNDMGERLAETERRLAERLDVLRATDTSGQLAHQLEGVEGRMHAQLTAAVSGLPSDRDVSQQLRAAELRITQHVDEAVLALAQAVLGGRAAAAVPAGQGPTAPTFEPVAFDPQPTGPEPVLDAEPADPEPVADPEQTDLEPAPDPEQADLGPAAADEPDDVAPADPEPVDLEPAADLEPVPAYGTDDLGLLPPETVAAEPVGLAASDEPEHGQVEAWAKGDATYAEVDGATDATDAAAETGETAEVEPVPAAAVDVHVEDSAEAEPAEPEALEPEAPEPEAPQPAYTLHTVGSPVDGDPARPALPPPSAGGTVVTPDVLPEPGAQPAPARKGLFRRKH